MDNKRTKLSHSVKTIPESVMRNKKMLYIHGFASSGQSGTVKRLKAMFPETIIITPDLPIHPYEALVMLHAICQTECPYIIIGTSMGGMYAEQLRGYDRILVNPAFNMGDVILQNNMMGKGVFLNPRRDGVQEFYMDEQLRQEYCEVSEMCFQGITEDDAPHVYGLFGTDDTIVNTWDLFKEHYTNAIQFKGGHRLNDNILIHVVAPLIREIDKRQ